MQVDRSCTVQDALAANWVVQRTQHCGTSACIGLLILLLASPAAAALCHVDAGAGGADTGASWSEACTDLHSALTNAYRAAANGGAIALDGHSGGVSHPTLSEIIFSGNNAGGISVGRFLTSGGGGRNVPGRGGGAAA